MTTQVRVFAHSGLSTPPVKGTSGRFTSDSLFLLKQPYLAGETLSASGTATSTVAGTAPDGTALFFIQVAPGGRIAFEVTPSGHTARVATATGSPVIEGNTQVEAGPGWILSCIEAA